MYKKIILVFILSVLGKANAQSFTDGIFTTTFGNISWTTETGTDYPNGGMVYGDYKDKGTIIGSFDNNGKEVVGSFHNGAAEGKFVFITPYGKDNFFANGIKTFAGNWGYSSNNKYSQNPDYEWKVTGKIGEKDAVKNVTNVWSGKWNTTDGAMYLMQVGNKITGTYKGVGTVEATYNPSTRLLKGTFTNNNFNKTGYIEFYFEGNTFKGKWGWNTSMTEGNWDGTKHVKNNKELSKNVLTNQLSNSSSKKILFRIQAKSIYLNEHGVNPSNVSLYGFVGFELYKVTNNSRVEVLSFGNKSKYLFNTNENQAFVEGSTYIFPNQPTYYREYEISEADWNNNNIQFELKVFHHIKAEKFGSNRDGKYFSETLDFKLIKLNTNLVAKREYQKEFGEYYGLLNYIITKL
ncbi:hypothetical protein [Flavobacterium sp.]|mgnify:CR=1 FL=1|jgi:hypothetical protein|uniref:hypothetical protein n=1 Tax=Flavobacterium sp. TaxID=239 RepID=UPI002B75897D|nr:hypothetical protein [Flavobacterium sp.]HQA73431.1 hypothetical protein [Flavobacterium sp.]